MVADCAICHELEGTIPLPGGVLWSNEHVLGYHMPPQDKNLRPYLGHLTVVTRRHVPYLADLRDEESASVGLAATRLALALKETAGAEWVFSAVIGTGTPHFHQHLLPRYPDTPEEVPWHSIDEWSGGVHGGPDEIEEFCQRLMTAPSLSAS